MKEKLSSVITLVLNNKKYLIALVGVLVVAEIVWAVTSGSFSSFMPSSKNQPLNIFQPPVKSQITSVTLSFPQDTFTSPISVGNIFGMDIKIFSEKLTDGTDLIISYDPQFLKVNLDAQTQGPLTPGTLYKDFPLNSVDESSGKITVSGISSASGGVLAKGLFGTVSFTALKAGATEIKVDYTPASTIDSNVIESKTAKDLLNQVNNLKVSITP